MLPLQRTYSFDLILQRQERQGILWMAHEFTTVVYKPWYHIVSIDISYIPRCSMYAIFTYIYPRNCTNVGKYSIHGASGIYIYIYILYIYISYLP